MSIIRHANKFDLPHVIRMLHDYKKQSPLSIMATCDNEEHVSRIFNAILHGRGVALIAEKEQPIGMLLGFIDQNIWDPNILMMREICYWIDENHRGGTAGYRLLKEYNKIGEDLVEAGRIEAYAISKMVNSPDLKYERFGYKKIEENWVAGV